MTKTAVVHELRGRGLHVATLQGNTIFSLGTYHEILVFDGNCEQEQAESKQRQTLIDSRTLAATVTDTVGLEIAFGRRWSGLTLGRHQAAVLVDAPQDAEIARRLHLNLQDLLSTRLETLNDTICKKET